jgi:class 3 adenylate cyclase
MLRGAQRRLTRSVLFTDIVGSTETAAQLGDQRWRGTLAQHHAVVRRELRRFHGREVDTAGDGFFAVFESPTEAVRCAAAVAPAVRRIGLDVRVGIHTGDVETSGEKVSGIAVHIGARLMAMAGPGEVLVSGTVRDLVAGSGNEFVDRGRHELKGVPGTWQVFSLVLPELAEPAAIAVAEEGAERRVSGRLRIGLLGAGLAGVGLFAVAWIAIALSRGSAPLALATTTPTEQAGSSPSATPPATALPRPLPGTRALSRLVGSTGSTGELQAGVKYSPMWFIPAFTLAGVSSWWSVFDISDEVEFVEGPNEPRPPFTIGAARASGDVLVLWILRPNRVIPIGGGAIPVPSGLATWLESRSDLDLSSPSPVTIGRFSGTRLEATIGAGATVNDHHAINLICIPLSDCSWNGDSSAAVISLGSSDTIEILVLNVGGDHIVIAATAASTIWPDARAKVDQLLRGLAFVPGS